MTIDRSRVRHPIFQVTHPTLLLVFLLITSSPHPSKNTKPHWRTGV
ncbi:hypothetical protein CKA32_000505 [Geitlerinema sp. FC II]|nr:hypothetical protein CKA32_000505 [Geitlerinema sp. FC II]